MFPLLKQNTIQFYIFLVNNNQEIMKDQKQPFKKQSDQKQKCLVYESLKTPERVKHKELNTTQKSDSKTTYFNIDPISLDLCMKEPIKQPSCNCKKSQCLKMYCVCFSDGKMCNNTCLCQSCLNKNDNQKRSESINEIITKDPFAFSKGFNVRSQNTGDGCNCKRSNCSKKYCECFRNGKNCGKKCLCVDCQNKKKVEQSVPSKRVKLQ